MKPRLRLLVLLTCLAAACLYVYRLEVPETRTWPAAPVGNLLVSTGNGAVVVAASTDTLISADIVRRCYGRNKADAESAIDNVVVSDTIIGSELRLSAATPAGSRNYGADFDVAAPDTVAVDVATSNGAVSVSGMKRGARVSTSNGKVTALGTGGSLELETSNGAVTVTVHRGNVAAVTSNGAVECDVAELGATESALLETSNGDVTLWLPEDVSATFDATTSNGEVTVSGFTTVTWDVSERTHKSGRIGSGASAVTVTTTNGSILIRAR